MPLTYKALLLRIDAMKKAAIEEFANNPYVTIHDYRNSPSAEKRNPLTVWIDLNFPVYVLNGKTPVLKRDGISDICIKFDTGYPENRPRVTLPTDIASVHTWNNRTACTHAQYSAREHNLAKEISSIMTLAANCDEAVNFKSMTQDHSYLAEWTKKSLEKGILPTVSYEKLLDRRRRRVRLHARKI